MQYLMNFCHPEGQVAHRIERLQQYDFSTEHRPGPLHGNAEALSLSLRRLPSLERLEGQEVMGPEGVLRVDALLILGHKMLTKT